MASPGMMEILGEAPEESPVVKWVTKIANILDQQVNLFHDTLDERTTMTTKGVEEFNEGVRGLK